VRTKVPNFSPKTKSLDAKMKQQQDRMCAGIGAGVQIDKNESANIDIGQIERVQSLSEKIETYEETKRQMDEAKAKGEMLSGSALCVGEHVEVYSESAGGWVPGVVVRLVDSEARVQYNVGDKPRVKLVAAVSSELRRNISKPGLIIGGNTGKGKLQLDKSALKRAKAALLRVPSARTLDSIRELVQWTYHVDLFHGLTFAERQKLCLEAPNEVAEEHASLVNVGQSQSAIHVIFSGRSAIYTVRVVDEDVHKMLSKTVPEERLGNKFKSMQRRVSVAVRKGSIVQLDSVEPLATRRASVAFAMNTETAGAAKKPEKRGGNGIKLRSMSIVPEDGSNQVEPEAGDPLRSSNVTSFPVQLTFTPGDAIGVQRAFHNNHAAINYAGLSEEEGLRRATHTVVVLEDTIAMVFEKAEHIAMFKRGFDRSLIEKVKVLRSVPNYTQCTRDCLVEMAKFTRRVWHPPGEVLIQQGDEAHEIYYIVTGTVRIVANIGTAKEQLLNVIGPGSCFGDWGVVNRKPRGATCLTSTDAEVLLINAFNFKATVDQVRDITRFVEGGGIRTFHVYTRVQALLLELGETTTEVAALGKSSKNVAGRPHEQKQELVVDTKTKDSFKLISRRSVIAVKHSHFTAFLWLKLMRTIAKTICCHAV
jgi:CRP-like cAMP-binding protein